MTKLRILIAGQISEDPDFKEVQKRFEASEKRINSLGYYAVNPLKHIIKDDSNTWFDYVADAIKLQGTCDAIYMQRGWGCSNGSQLQHDCADRKNIQVVYESQSDESLKTDLK